jgi:hypothetical protein
MRADGYVLARIVENLVEALPIGCLAQNSERKAGFSVDGASPTGGECPSYPISADQSEPLLQKRPRKAAGAGAPATDAVHRSVDHN